MSNIWTDLWDSVQNQSGKHLHLDQMVKQESYELTEGTKLILAGFTVSLALNWTGSWGGRSQHHRGLGEGGGFHQDGASITKTDIIITIISV